MFDRAIGIAGLAIGIIFGLFPYLAPDVPRWVALGGIGVGILLLGISVGLIFGRGSRHRRHTVDKALLRLHVYGDNRFPDRLAAENIFRWYYLGLMITAAAPDGTTQKMIFPTFFVSFEPDVKITTLQVRSPDMTLPPHEVKEFNQRYAIITFTGNIAEGTLEFTVSP